MRPYTIRQLEIRDHFQVDFSKILTGEAEFTDAPTWSAFERGGQSNEVAPASIVELKYEQE